MGQIVKQVGEGTTKYYWYPGDKREWGRSAFALGLGVLVFGLALVITHRSLFSVTLGATVMAFLAGLNFGRRDARAIVGFRDLSEKAAKRAAVVHTGRAAWRGMVEGVGGAMVAVLIVNLPQHGFVANWLLPIVPAGVGALAHQAGMMMDQLTREVSTAKTHPTTPRRPTAR